MKTYKTYSAAKRNNKHNQPIVKVGLSSECVYIVFDQPMEPVDIRLTEIGIIRDGGVTGWVGIGHLERLRNGNWAFANHNYEMASEV